MNYTRTSPRVGNAFTTVQSLRPSENNTSLGFIDMAELDRLELVKKARMMRTQSNTFLGSNKLTDKHQIEIKGIGETEVIANRYEILGLVDSGATGNTHLVYDRNTRETLALKTLREGMHEEGIIRRFVREAGALASLSHPNIVTVKDLGWDNNRPFIVMEFVANTSKEGFHDFSNLVDQFQKGKIDLKTMLFYFADLCDALNYLHTRPRPIIHRDLKPKNILVSDETVTDNGPSRLKIKLADFGLAKVTAGDLTTLTVRGQVMGTPAYAPIPDLLNESREYRLDGRSDLYSLGVMLYSLVAGRLPFTIENSEIIESPIHDSDGYILKIASPVDADTPKAGANASTPRSSQQSDLYVVMQKHLHEQPDFSIIRDATPQALIDLTQRLLEKDPDSRPSNAKTVGQRLRDIASDISPIPVPRFITQGAA